MRLSERRASFVSAVTYELRTPLTTFRMYADMLVEGMVPDEARRQKYLGTLRTEADRLGHLVENVLAYARLERGRQRRTPQRAQVHELISQWQTRLQDRAARDGMQLQTALSPEVSERWLKTDASAVEQILFNLVDNACKYAGAATDKRIELSVTLEGGLVRFRVRDFGPGVDAQTASRLFKPFRKSAQAAANSAPGVGLGLSLCRQLARAMGGELRFAGAAPGASFEFELPAVG
jgi:signal transduction histidine kinase